MNYDTLNSNDLFEKINSNYILDNYETPNRTKSIEK